MKKNLPILLLVVGFLFVVVAVVVAFVGPKLDSAQAVPVPAAGLADVGGAAPKTLAGFPMSSSQVGAAALDNIQQLHAANIPLVSGVLAVYGTKSATLWVAETGSDAEALKLVQSMEDKIAQGGSGFTTKGVFQFRKRDIYMMETATTSEFFMQSGKKVLWVSILPEQAEQAMKEMLDFYP